MQGEEQNQEQGQEQFNPDDFMQTGDQHEGQEEQQQEQQQQEEQQQQQQQQEYDEYFSALQQEIGEIDPEISTMLKSGKDSEGNALTPIAKLNILRDLIMDSVLLGGNEEHDAFIRDYMTASSQENFDRSKWIQERQESMQFMNLPSKEFLKTYYKRYSEQNKKGWTDADISAKVDKMDTIDADMEAGRVKEYINKSASQARSQAYLDNFNKNKEKITKSIETDNENIQKDITKFIASIQNQKVIGGFELGDSDKEEFIKALPEFTKRKIFKTSTGEIMIASEADMVLEEIKAKPEMSTNMLVYLYLTKHKKLDGLFSNAVEKRKRNLEETLDDAQGSSANRGGSRAAGFDPQRFMQ